MRTIISVTIIFLIGYLQTSYLQPQNVKLKSKADSLRYEGNLDEAVAEYHKQYTNNPFDKTNLYNYACALSLSGHNDSCFKYLNIYLTLDTSIKIMTDPDFCPIRRDKRWNDFEDRVIHQYNIKYNKPFQNIDYAKKLWRMGAIDQFCFSEIGIANRKTGRNSSVVRGIWECKFIISEFNQKELDGLIDKHGWPRSHVVGKEAVNMAFRIILHSNSALINKYLSDIKKICIEKELPWERYATIYDRALWYDKKPQKYGTHTRYNETTNSEELYPLENESRVDEWRSELGLEPLKVYLAKLNIKFESQRK